MQKESKSADCKLTQKAKCFNCDFYKESYKSYRSTINQLLNRIINVAPRDILIEILKKKKIISRDWTKNGEVYELHKNLVNQKNAKIQEDL